MGWKLCTKKEDKVQVQTDRKEESKKKEPESRIIAISRSQIPSSYCTEVSAILSLAPSAAPFESGSENRTR